MPARWRSLGGGKMRRNRELAARGARLRRRKDPRRRAARDRDGGGVATSLGSVLVVLIVLIVLIVLGLAKMGRREPDVDALARDGLRARPRPVPLEELTRLAPSAQSPHHSSPISRSLRSSRLVSVPSLRSACSRRIRSASSSVRCRTRRSHVYSAFRAAGSPRANRCTKPSMTYVIAGYPALRRFAASSSP